VKDESAQGTSSVTDSIVKRLRAADDTSLSTKLNNMLEKTKNRSRKNSREDAEILRLRNNSKLESEREAAKRKNESK